MKTGFVSTMYWREDFDLSMPSFSRLWNVINPKNMNYFFCAKHALVFKVLGAGHKRISTAESNGEDKKVNWWSEDFRGLSRRPASIIVSFLCFLYLLMRRSNQKELNYLHFYKGIMLVFTTPQFQVWSSDSLKVWNISFSFFE